MNNVKQSIKDIFTPEVIEHLKHNKNLITAELLDELRTSNEGKNIAFEILDLQKNEEGYYIDSFGNTIAYKKIPSLKSINRKLPMSEIHKQEIEKCRNNIFYFMRNYVKIKTKTGVEYPELRYYQLEFLDCIIKDEHESIVGLLPRQSGKSITVGIYLCWLSIFEKDVDIGIAAQIASMAKEFIIKVKDIFINLPIWLTPGVKTWNVRSISLENGVRIVSDSASSNSFRGYTVTYSVTDESAYITGKDNGTTRFSSYLDAVLPSQSSLAKKKNIFISTANGMNEFYDLYKGAQKDGYDIIEKIVPGNFIIAGDLVQNHFNSFEKSDEIIDIEIISDSSVKSILSDSEKALIVTEVDSTSLFNIKYKQRKLGSNNSIAFSTSWKKVPRWKKDGTAKTPVEFYEEEVAKKGEVFFNQAYACVDINTKVKVYDKLTGAFFETTMAELKKQINTI